MFWVQGGVHANTTWDQVLPGKEEVYGPFQTRDQALITWRARTWANVDVATHRLFIVDQEPGRQQTA